jgi:hypothetical protein
MWCALQTTNHSWDKHQDILRIWEVRQECKRYSSICSNWNSGQELCGLLQILSNLWSICYKTSSMEQSPSWEANTLTARQEILYLLCNLKVHYHVHKSPPMVLILSQMNLDHNLPPHLILSSHLYLGIPSGHFPSEFLTKILYALISPKSDTCPNHFILYLTALTIHGEQHKLWRLYSCYTLADIYIVKVTDQILYESYRNPPNIAATGGNLRHII